MVRIDKMEGERAKYPRCTQHSPSPAEGDLLHKRLRLKRRVRRSTFCRQAKLPNSSLFLLGKLFKRFRGSLGSGRRDTITRESDVHSITDGPSKSNRRKLLADIASPETIVKQLSLQTFPGDLMKCIRTRYVFPFCLLFLAACHHHSKSVGHEFIGKWINIESPSDSVVIARDGNKFVITDGIHALIATYDDGALAPNNGKGKCSYLKVTDTMDCGGVTYKRTS